MKPADLHKSRHVLSVADSPVITSYRSNVAEIDYQPPSHQPQLVKNTIFSLWVYTAESFFLFFFSFLIFLPCGANAFKLFRFGGFYSERSPHKEPVNCVKLCQYPRRAERRINHLFSRRPSSLPSFALAKFASAAPCSALLSLPFTIFYFLFFYFR